MSPVAGAIATFMDLGVKHVLVRGPGNFLVITPEILIGPARVIAMSTMTVHPLTKEEQVVEHNRFYSTTDDGTTWFRLVPASREGQPHPQRGVRLRDHNVGDLVVLGVRQYQVKGRTDAGRWVLSGKIH